VREKRKGKNNLPKKNSPRLLLLADLSFAIDAQHDKSGFLQGWYPGCNWTIPRGQERIFQIVIEIFDKYKGEMMKRIREDIWNNLRWQI
jgi:hypothetical protein